MVVVEVAVEVVVVVVEGYGGVERCRRQLSCFHAWPPLWWLLSRGRDARLRARCWRLRAMAFSDDKSRPEGEVKSRAGAAREGKRPLCGLLWRHAGHCSVRFGAFAHSSGE